MNTEKTPKLDQYQKAERKDLRAYVRSIGGDVFTFPEQRISVVVVPATEGMSETSKFVQFTVAQCAEHDKFRRKTGEFKALESYDAGRAVSLRRAESWNGEQMNNEEMAQIVANFFE